MPEITVVRHQKKEVMLGGRGIKIETTDATMAQVDQAGFSHVCSCFDFNAPIAF